MNIDKLFDKYSVGIMQNNNIIIKIITKENFTQAIAEIISHPLEAEVKQAACGKWQRKKPYNGVGNNAL